MATFETIPTELRHQILKNVLLTPLIPPTSLDGIDKSDWPFADDGRIGQHVRPFDQERYARDASLYQYSEGNHQHGLSFNNRYPQHLTLLLVSRSFKSDVTYLLSQMSSDMVPTLDILAKDWLHTSWLQAPLPGSCTLDRLNIQIRCLEEECTQKHDPKSKSDHLYII
jgi:hypothetical protein